MSGRTKLFSGFGFTERARTFWKRGTAIEVFKFVLCLTAPVGASVIYADPDIMKTLILKLNLVTYPKAGPSPATNMEIEAVRESIRLQQKEQR